MAMAHGRQAGEMEAREGPGQESSDAGQEAEQGQEPVSVTRQKRQYKQQDDCGDSYKPDFHRAVQHSPRKFSVLHFDSPRWMPPAAMLCGDPRVLSTAPTYAKPRGPGDYNPYPEDLVCTPLLQIMPKSYKPKCIHRMEAKRLHLHLQAPGKDPFRESCVFKTTSNHASPIYFQPEPDLTDRMYRTIKHDDAHWRSKGLAVDRGDRVVNPASWGTSLRDMNRKHTDLDPTSYCPAVDCKGKPFALADNVKPPSNTQASGQKLAFGVRTYLEGRDPMMRKQPAVVQKAPHPAWYQPELMTWRERFRISRSPWSPALRAGFSSSSSWLLHDMMPSLHRSDHLLHLRAVQDMCETRKRFTQGGPLG